MIEWGYAVLALAVGLFVGWEGHKKYLQHNERIATEALENSRGGKWKLDPISAESQIAKIAQKAMARCTKTKVIDGITYIPESEVRYVMSHFGSEFYDYVTNEADKATKEYCAFIYTSRQSLQGEELKREGLRIEENMRAALKIMETLPVENEAIREAMRADICRKGRLELARLMGMDIE